VFAVRGEGEIATRRGRARGERAHLGGDGIDRAGRLEDGGGEGDEDGCGGRYQRVGVGEEVATHAEDDAIEAEAEAGEGEGPAAAMVTARSFSGGGTGGG
jgi:hypothetical protein